VVPGDGLLTQVAPLDDLPPVDLPRVDCFQDGYSLLASSVDSAARPVADSVPQA
jgi:hypothetical protein